MNFKTETQLRQELNEALAMARAERAGSEALRKALAQSCSDERQQAWEAGPGGGCSRALTAEAKTETLSKDAERYRWLAKEHGWWLLKHFPAVRTYVDASEVIDESIDAAMR